MSISGMFSDFGAAAGDLITAQGDFASANAYGIGASISTENADITKRSGEIQQQQENQAITKAIGGENATTAGAGLSNAGGSAVDLMRSSVQQGALSRQLLANQTEITVQGFTQQAAAFKGQQAAAEAAGQSLEAEGAASGVAGIASAAGWIICTEFVKQRRMPQRWYNYGAQVFRWYPDAVKEGYYVWAVPSVRHIRAHPYSPYSRFLCMIFNWRAENIAAHAGVPKARKLLRGKIITAVLWPICYAIGWVRMRLNKRTDWENTYAER